MNEKDSANILTVLGKMEVKDSILIPINPNEYYANFIIENDSIEKILRDFDSKFTFTMKAEAKGIRIWRSE